MKGKNYLKVTGILMIIFSGFSILWFLSALGVFIGSLNDGNVGNFLDSLHLVAAGILAILGLVAGILGVAYCKKPDKAKICLAVGIALLTLQVFSAILLVVYLFDIVNISDTVDIWFGWVLLDLASIISLSLPVLYIIGAVLNLKSKKQDTTSVSN